MSDPLSLAAEEPNTCPLSFTLTVANAVRSSALPRVKLTLTRTIGATKDVADLAATIGDVIAALQRGDLDPQHLPRKGDFAPVVNREAETITVTIKSLGVTIMAYAKDDQIRCNLAFLSESAAQAAMDRFQDERRVGDDIWHEDRNWGSPPGR